MPAGSALGLYHEVLHAIVGGVGLGLPHLQASPRDLPGKVSLTQIEHALPEKPLVRHPDGAIPIAVLPIVRGGLVHGAQACLAPELRGGLECPQHRCGLRRGPDARHERVDPVEPPVVVDPCRGAEDSRGSARRVVTNIAEIARLLVPGVLLQGTRESRDVRTVHGDILWESQFARRHDHDLGDADCLRRVDDGCHPRGKALLVGRLLGRVIIPAARIVEIVKTTEQARGEFPHRRTPEPSDVEEVVLPEPRIAVLEERSRLRPVP